MIDTDTALKGFLINNDLIGPQVGGERVFDSFAFPGTEKPYIIFEEIRHSVRKMSTVGSLDFLQFNYDIRSYGLDKDSAKKLTGDIQDEFYKLLPDLPLILDPASSPDIGIHLFTINSAFASHEMARDESKTVSYRYIIDISMAFKELITP